MKAAASASLRPVGIVEKHTRRGGRKGFQQAHEFRLSPRRSDRIGDLCKAQSFDGRANHLGTSLAIKVLKRRLDGLIA